MKQNRSSVRKAPPRDVRRWLRIALAAVIVAAFGCLYLYGLGSLLPAAPVETATQAQSGLAQLTNNPLNLPYKLLLVAALHIGNSPEWLRMPAVIMTAFSVCLCYVICRKWYGTLAATAATVLFATSSWSLQTGRLGAAYAGLTASTLALVAAATWFKTNPNRRTGSFFAAALATICLVPGGIWLAAAVCTVLTKPLGKALWSDKRLLMIYGTIGVTTLAVLAQAWIRQPALIAAWLGLPADWPALLVILKQAVMSLTFLVARGPVQPDIWLGHTPILDVASTVLALIGVILYGRNVRNSRSLLLMAFIVPAVLLVALNGVHAMPFLVPTIYLIIGGGLAYVFREWRTVFPRNPLAHGLATLLVVVLVGCIIRFHVTRSFVAWPHSPDTIHAYQSRDNAPPNNLIQ